ncbi:hypothetical protein H633G_11285 [Metarhizium anisopliae BRIP 53284]|nr:hypothetical protein H633G_11285 [Metarhizium anisopliae BRIP 53284]
MPRLQLRLLNSMISERCFTASCSAATFSRNGRTDPFVSNPQSISTVLWQFFGHIDNAIVIRFLPEDIFKSWVVSSAHRKSPDDMMLLYSILAIGMILSRGPKDTAFEYAQVAHYAQKSLTTASLHLAQSRILLALRLFATQ